ncbi:MAG: PHP domain-containing protein [Spirochaetales bacterium]|nr:PHP domain-containing protein [Spirochaetales bacterium]
MVIDLHVHSNRSDGSDSLESLFDKARGLGVKRFALTDHDVLDKLELAVKLAKSYGIDLIPGVEVSAFDEKRDRKVHILGLNIDYNDIALNNFLENIREQRQYAAKQMVARIKTLGYPLEWDEVVSLAGETGCVFKTHIMQSLINNGICEDLHGSLHKKLFSKGGIACVPLDYPEAEDAVIAIKNAKGMAVIAHPALYNNKELISSLIPFGLDGVEVFHPSHTQQDTDELLTIARQNNLFITGGSDYHGNYGNSHIHIGDYGISEDAYHSVTYFNQKHQIGGPHE